MTPSVALLDLYETLVAGDWPRWEERVRSRIGVDEPVLDDALDRTREARNTGAYPSEADDWRAVLTAAGLSPDEGTIADVIAIQRDFMTTAVGLYDDSLPVVRELRARGGAT